MVRTWVSYSINCIHGAYGYHIVLYYLKTAYISYHIDIQAPWVSYASSMQHTIAEILDLWMNVHPVDG